MKWIVNIWLQGSLVLSTLKMTGKVLITAWWLTFMIDCPACCHGYLWSCLHQVTDVGRGLTGGCQPIMSNVPFGLYPCFTGICSLFFPPKTLLEPDQLTSSEHSCESVIFSEIMYWTIVRNQIYLWENLISTFRHGSRGGGGGIWTQAVWHSDSVHERIFLKSWFWRNQRTTRKNHEKLPSMQRVKCKNFWE